MNFSGFKKAMQIGFAATVMMTVYLYFANTLKFPAMDFHGFITTHFHTGAMATWLVYFFVGGAFACLYRTYFHDKLPSHSWKRGVYYGIVLWAFFGLVLMPVMGTSFFAGSVMASVGLFLTVTCYGATVGYLYES